MSKTTHDNLTKSNDAQTTRQYNLDLLKAVAIISMILCHSVFRLGLHQPGYEQDIRYWIGDVFLGEYLAVAHAFMFAMGVGIVYSRRNRPADLIRRGIWLYALGFILNFFRYGIYALADGIIEGEFMADTVYALVAQDILQFAGLALIATGLLKYLKLKEGHIFIIGVILSAIGGPLAFCFQGSDIANYFVGHFIVTTEDGSCFTFLNWYVFVAAGLLFGAILQKTENKDRFYGKMLRTACPVMVLYIVLSIACGQFFLTKNGWYYGASLPEAAGLLSIDLTLLSAFHFLSKNVEISRFSVFITMSRNVNQIYCIHWCILGFVESVFCYLIGIVFPWPFIYLFGIVLIILSYWIAKKWTNRIKS